MYEDKIKPSSDSDIKLAQSDILKDILFSATNSNLLAILITPACDMANHNGDLNYVHFCAVLPFEQFFFELIRKNRNINLTEEEFLADFSNGKRKAIISELKRIVNGQYTNYQWLGKLPGMGSGYWYVDFDLTQCIDFNKEKEVLKEKRVFQLESPLKESVFVRYSTHMGRVGLPGENDEREKYVNNIIDEMRSR